MSVKAVAFSPDGKLIAPASDDDTVWRQDAATGATTHAFKNCSAFTLAFSKDSLHFKLTEAYILTTVKTGQYDMVCTAKHIVIYHVLG